MKSISIPEPIRALAEALGVPATALLEGYAQAALALSRGVKLDEIDIFTARRVGAVMHAFQDSKRALQAARDVLEEAGIKPDWGTLLAYMAVGIALEKRRFARARGTPKRPGKGTNGEPRKDVFKDVFELDDIPEYATPGGPM